VAQRDLQRLRQVIGVGRHRRQDAGRRCACISNLSF
jgi:hypothetical protein